MDMSYHGSSASACRRRSLLYLDHFVNLNEDMLSNFKHPVYLKNTQCVLYRWHNSFGYAVRKFYKSVSRILTCDTGMGTDVLGIFGMDFKDRAALLVEGNSIIGAKWTTGDLRIVDEEGNVKKSKKKKIEKEEIVMILPRFEEEGIAELRNFGILTKDGDDCFIALIDYMKKASNKNDIKEEMVKLFDPPNDEGVVEFVDNYTPSCFERMIRGKDNPDAFIESIRLLCNLVISIGVGSITNKGGYPCQPSQMLQYLFADTSEDSGFNSIITLAPLKDQDPILPG